MGLRGRKLRGARGAGIRLPRMAFGITIVVRPFSIHGLLLAGTGSATSSRIGCSSTARTRKNSPSSMHARGTIASCWGCTAFKFAQRRGATMSRLNLVERELGQLDGGSFQKLAETYVYRKLHLKSITALGSQPGTNKTTKGIPDAHSLADGEAILIPFTTAQCNSFYKLKSDIEECISVKIPDGYNRKYHLLSSCMEADSRAGRRALGARFSNRAYWTQDHCHGLG